MLFRSTVVSYVEQAFQKLHKCKNPAGVHCWLDSQERKLLKEKVNLHRDTDRWKRSNSDSKVKQVPGALQIQIGRASCRERV